MSRSFLAFHDHQNTMVVFTNNQIDSKIHIANKMQK